MCCLARLHEKYAFERKPYPSPPVIADALNMSERKQRWRWHCRHDNTPRMQFAVNFASPLTTPRVSFLQNCMRSLGLYAISRLAQQSNTLLVHRVACLARLPRHDPIKCVPAKAHGAIAAP